MADLNKTSRIENLAKFVETYGAAVRAGVITPNVEDERALRELMELPVPSDAVLKSWNETKGVRLPITLQQDEKPVAKTPEKDGDQL